MSRRARSAQDILCSLSLAAILGMGMAGCAGMPPAPERPQAAKPLPPGYETKVLQDRQSLEHQLQDYQLILQNIDHLISVLPPHLERGPGGTVSLSDHTAGLRQMRLDTERQYNYVFGSLLSLESQVKRDFGGKLPSWWKPLR